MVFTDSGEAKEGFPILNIAESVLGCFDTGLVCLDNLRIVCALNSQAEKLLGLKASYLLEKSVVELPDPLPKIIDEIFLTGKNLVDGEYYLSTKNGVTRCFRINASTVSLAKGGPRGVILLISDFTMAQNLEKSMRRLDRLASVGTFLASMAHEIKNAMQPISTFIDAILGKVRNQMLLTDVEDLKLMEIVDHEMARTNSLLTRMLRISRPGKPNITLVHGHKILEDSLQLIKHQIEGKSITLIKSLHAENDSVSADAYELEQAFLNVLINAVEAMSSGGTLEVATFLLPPNTKLNFSARFKVTITDSGVGIPPENMSRLFDTFFTTKSNGTGLGLAITRRIIGEHLGEIEVQSTLNEGTIVSILLPLSESPSNASNQSKSEG